ncbi:MAG TPA: DUF4350 domain-containing protein [Polyangia bacterium]|nr:DUF4350 domain-containing protein [Polyangia bacterium]
MAMTQTPSGAGRIGPSARWSAVYAAGMLAIFAGERIIGSGRPRAVATILGLVLVLAAMVVRVLRAKQAPPDRRQAERSLLGLYALGLLSVVIYFVQSDVPTLRGGKPLEHGWPKLATVLSAIWPALWIASAWPIGLVELAYANMARAPHMEVGRIRDALLSGLGIAFALIFAFSVAWVTSERDKRVDLAYFRTTRPGEATRKIVRSLDQPVEISSFFAAGTEVREEVNNYFTELARESNQLQFKAYDFDLEPTRARDLTVTANGTIAVSRNARKELLQVPTQLETARSALKTLDKEVQQRLLTVVKPKRVVLFTQGHNERWFEKGALNDADQRPGMRDLREVMRDQGHEVRSFGAADGLMTDVPKDATLVMVIGPQKRFEPEEIGTLMRYFDRGGRILVALDPEAGLDFKDLLGPLGVTFHTTTLANEQQFARRTHQDSDHVNLVTASFSAHPAMSTVSRLAGRAPLILPGAGWLEMAKIKPNGIALDAPVRSQPTTFDDKNGNFKKDDGEEQRAFDLAVAVTKGSGRMFVFADSDFLSDAAIRVGGNGILMLDTVRWLMGDEAYTGQTNTEADVPITHTRKQDVAWFYSSIFLMPVLVLGVGFLVTRGRRRGKVVAAARSANQGVAP